VAGLGVPSVWMNIAASLSLSGAVHHCGRANLERF
jgi:hypothetical protein